MFRKLTNTLRVIYLAWAVWLVAVLVGAKSDVLAKAAFGVSVICFALNWAKRRELGDKIVRDLERWVTPRRVLLGIALISVIQIAALFADHWALNGTLWDLALYIQLIAAKARTGHPWSLFTGQILDYNHNHLSLSLYFLAWAAKLFPAAWVAHVWMGFALFAPAFVFWFWARLLHRQAMPKTKAEGLGVLYLSAAALWAFSPAVLRMETWPYTLESGGFALLAGSYYFYFLKTDSSSASIRPWLLKWGGWAACLVLAPLEKEDFGLFGATFGLMVIAEQGVRAFRGRKKKNSSVPPTPVLVPILLGFLVIAVSVGALAYIHATGRGTVSTFGSRFADFGATPQEAILNFFARPKIVLKLLMRPLVLRYLAYFAVMTYFWIRPSLKSWLEIAWVYLPALPTLLANVMSSNPAMYEIKDPYALPVQVGLGAAVLFGTYRMGQKGRSQSTPQITPWNRFCLLVMAAGFLLWGQQFPTRTLKKRLQDGIKRTPARAAMQWIKDDPNLILCCEDRLCTWFAERERMFTVQACLERTSDVKRLLELDGSEGTVFVVYSKSLEASGDLGKIKALSSLKWRYQDDFASISEPMAFDRSTANREQPTPGAARSRSVRHHERVLGQKN